jgi:hypothetical protein
VSLDRFLDAWPIFTRSTYEGYQSIIAGIKNADRKLLDRSKVVQHESASPVEFRLIHGGSFYVQIPEGCLRAQPGTKIWLAHDVAIVSTRDVCTGFHGRPERVA